MSLKDANPRLEEPKQLPKKTSAWRSTKLSDPGAAPVLERFSHNINAKKLTGGMIMKEFPAQCLAPLEAHSGPLWEYRVGDDGLRLRSRDLPTEDLSRAVAILLGNELGDLPKALGPLYRRNDWADMVAAMYVFNELGLLPAEGSGLVEVSSDDTSGQGDWEKTVDDRPTSVPLPSQSVLLRELEDVDATGVTPTRISSRLARVSMGPASTPRVVRSVCVLVSQKLRVEPSPTHPASAGGKFEAPSSPPSMGALSPLLSLGRTGGRDGAMSKSKLLAWARLARLLSALG
ncbi:hypothetical protein D1007_51878 [Hordeum vulgare]|nr:hypothetical protein D1007_51878 [Hordeum vulgare]